MLDAEQMKRDAGKKRWPGIVLGAVAGLILAVGALALLAVLPGPLVALIYLAVIVFAVIHARREKATPLQRLGSGDPEVIAGEKEPGFWRKVWSIVSLLP